MHQFCSHATLDTWWLHTDSLMLTSSMEAVNTNFDSVWFDAPGSKFTVSVTDRNTEQKIISVAPKTNIKHQANNAQ